MGKVNPNRRPASQADVDKALRRGMREGFKLSLDFTLHALMCDMEMDDEFLERFNHYFNALLGSFNAKGLKKNDVIQNMLDEKELEVYEV